MKQFIYGALSAFSVVAAYHLFKKLTNKEKTSVATCNNFFNNLTKDEESEVHDEAIKQPKLVSFNKEYIEERKEKLLTPSGLVLTSSREKGVSFFKHEIQNVIDNTDDKVVIFDIYKYFKPVLSSLGVDYEEISKDELNEDTMEKYERSIVDENAERPYIAPLTERITCFNVQNEEDVEATLRYVFMRSKVTVSKEYPKRVWLYIPSSLIAHYHAEQLFTIIKRSRMAGVIITAAAEMDSLIINDRVRLMANMQDYLAFTDDIDKYYVSDTLRELICSVDKAYQFEAKRAVVS